MHVSAWVDAEEADTLVMAAIEQFKKQAAAGTPFET